ncbi:MAG: sigma-70 family RNA polymerase sigma factor [Acidobacteriaceae bacterium]
MGNLEQEAIRRTLAGDRDAFRVLMDRHLPTVLRMTYRVTGNAIDAEEAAQEAFLLAYRKLPNFREESAFGTWVYRIAMNCSLNLVERRTRDLGWDAISLEPGSPTDNLAVSPHLNPEASLLHNEAILRRENAMLSLTPMERTAFILRHMEEQPLQVIADALGVPINSAKQAVFRAVAKLRRELAPAPPAATRQPATKPEKESR